MISLMRGPPGWNDKLPSAIWRWLCVAFLFMPGLAQALAEPNQLPPPAVQGYADSIVVKGGKIVAQGWAGAADSRRRIVSLSVWIAKTQIYDGGFERFDRPDVVTATGRKDWLKSGWRISAALPSNLGSGEYAVKVLAKLDNGVAANLNLNRQAETISADGRFSKGSQAIWATRTAIVVLFILVCLAYFQAEKLSGLIFSKADYFANPPAIFGLALFLCFVVLVGLGVTGSSFGLGLQQTPFVHSDEMNIWGKDRPIRSDEWLVMTPLAVSQYSHQPKFPVVNSNIGEAGENMLIVGMTGVPVAHISSIAKPATWGFFLFDLRRALSWYWCFPIFAGLFALWGVVALLLPGKWRLSFLTSLWFCVSPYVVAWSNWPAYAVFFPSIALLLFIAILQSRNKYLILTYGGILGVACAGFFLVLYPPWQVSLAYLFLALAVGVVVREKLYRNFTKIRLASYGVALIVSSWILWRWWLDAHQAVQAMLDTVYPGQRSADTGGGVSFPGLLRGYSNFITLYKLDGAYSNQSEIASFSYSLLPLIALFVLRIYQKAIGAVEIALAVSVNFFLYFMLVGIPIDVAQISFLSRVPSFRSDLSLGLSYIILCGVLLSSGARPITKKISVRSLALAVALIWAAIAFNSVSKLHPGILSNSPPAVFVGLFIAAVVCGYWLVLGKREYIYLSLALSVSTTCLFNPLNIAPHSVAATPSINGLLKKQTRILVLETQVPAMFLLASGHAVANGIFYYPPKALWERLDKKRTNANTYNRYQHLFFSGGAVGNKDHYRIESPQADVVRVVVDLARFDFRKTGAGLIVGPEKLESSLQKNPTIAYVKSDNGWSWFQVAEGSNAN